VGRIRQLRYGRRTVETAFVKEPVAGSLRLSALGFPGDEHAYHDHGGPDMAVLVYPMEHYAHWESLGLELVTPGAFGENLTVSGLTETDVHLGDIYEVGSAFVQVTQPRSPCYKIAARHGIKELPRLVQDTGFIGYLLRVLSEGDVEAGDSMRLVERGDHGVTVAEAGRVANVDRNDRATARRVLAVEALGSSTRRKLEARAGSGTDVGLETDRLYLHQDAEPN